jgi:hypothetical protein
MNDLNNSNLWWEYYPSTQRIYFDIFETKYQELSKNLGFDYSDKAQILYDRQWNYLVIWIMYKWYLQLSEWINHELLQYINSTNNFDISDLLIKMSDISQKNKFIKFTVNDNTLEQVQSILDSRWNFSENTEYKFMNLKIFSEVYCSLYTLCQVEWENFIYKKWNVNINIGNIENWTIFFFDNISKIDLDDLENHARVNLYESMILVKEVIWDITKK